MLVNDAATHGEAVLRNSITTSKSTRIGAIGSGRVAGLVRSMARQVPSSVIAIPATNNQTSAQEIRDTLCVDDYDHGRAPDICFVEISRAECLSHGDQLISFEQIEDRFAHILNTPQRKAQFAGALDSANSRDIAALLREWGVTDHGDVDFLVQLRLVTATEASLEADISEITATLRNPVFVINGAPNRAAGNAIRAQRNFAALLSFVLRRLDQTYVDLGPHLDAVGHEMAMASGDLQSDRYAPEFERYLAAQWIARFVPLATDGAAPRKPVLLPKRPACPSRRVLFAPLQSAVA